MHFAIIADAYPPMKTSGAIQIRDLVHEFIELGHLITVILPDSSIPDSWQLTEKDNVSILRLKAPVTKDISYARRAVAEFLLSYFMYSNLRKSPLKYQTWDGIIWYSPSIFFGSLVKKLKSKCQCPAYLILRDIFPEWAADMGLLKKGLVYRYFKSVELFQYIQADVIGVQTKSVLGYFNEFDKRITARLEVLNNWSRPIPVGFCSINLADTTLAGRKIFVYTGNIGIAQGMDILVDLAKAMEMDSSTGFVFVGRGTAVARIRSKAQNHDLENILFFDEINPDEIPGLLAQCEVGLIALDPRHRNDNIPGKFLAYMQAGIPVLANINPGNDLEDMINHHNVGAVITNNSLELLLEKANFVLSQVRDDKEVAQRCKKLSANTFSVSAAAKQIIAAFENKTT